MASNYRIERGRGTKESQQLALLRDKWPLAFPLEQQDVRPLATSAAREIAAAMDWSLPYTVGVLKNWKMAPVYCKAVLSYDQRITLDGTLAEAVDAKAKDLAAKRLAELTERNAAKHVAKTPAREVVKPKLAPAPPAETPEQLRARVRASLLRRSALRPARDPAA
jgi:sRNA-binding protein